MDDSGSSIYSFSSTTSESTLVPVPVPSLESNTRFAPAPAPSTPPSTFLSFSTGSINNTTVQRVFPGPSNLNESGTLYTITTDALSNSHTKILRGAPSKPERTIDADAPQRLRLVAEIKRRDLLPSTVRFSLWPTGPARTRKLKSWLHGPSGKATEFPISFEWNSASYTWKTSEALQVSLYNDSRPSTPIAWYKPGVHQRQTDAGSTGTQQPDILALRPEAERMLDPIIVSLIVVEQNLRWKYALYSNASRPYIPNPASVLT